MTKRILVDLNRCIGCWTCSMACKVGNHLDDDEFRITVQTHGSGAGIDRPAGVYPDLRMTWQPIFHRSCTFCADRQDGPLCVAACPPKALAFGDDTDPGSDYCKAVEHARERNSRIFELPDYEKTRAFITCASRV